MHATRSVDPVGPVFGMKAVGEQHRLAIPLLGDFNAVEAAARTCRRALAPGSASNRASEYCHSLLRARHRRHARLPDAEVESRREREGRDHAGAIATTAAMSTLALARDAPFPVVVNVVGHASDVPRGHR